MLKHLTFKANCKERSERCCVAQMQGRWEFVSQPVPLPGQLVKNADSGSGLWRAETAALTGSQVWPVLVHRLYLKEQPPGGPSGGGGEGGLRSHPPPSGSPPVASQSFCDFKNLIVK